MGRPRKAPGGRAPRTSGPSGKSGVTPPPSPEQVDTVRGLLLLIDPTGALGDDAGPALARVVGERSDAVSGVLSGRRAVSGERLARWVAAVVERVTVRQWTATCDREGSAPMVVEGTLSQALARAEAAFGCEADELGLVPAAG